MPARMPLSTKGPRKSTTTQSPPSKASATTISSLTPQSKHRTPQSDKKDVAVLTPDVLGTELVNLYVGSKRKHLTIHKKLICDRSEFFSKAFSGEFKEAKDGEIHLPEDDPEMMIYLVDYFYRGAIPKTSAEELAPLYYMGEKYCISDFMNHIIDTIRGYHRRMLGSFEPQTVLAIYKNTSEGSKLRLYAAAQIACDICTVVNHRRVWNVKSDIISSMDPDFFRDVFQMQNTHWETINAYKIRADDAKSPDGFGLCEFHVHEEGDTCAGKRDGQ